PCVPGFKFCGACGAPLAAGAADPGPREPAAASAAAAPPRGAASPPQADPFPAGYTPPHLAELLQRTGGAVEGERKQVTVLFCDLVGSTALAERVGPEAMHALLRGFFELGLGEIHRFGGTVNQFLGDGFMALFGAPIAHEDHARRAVLAALELRAKVREGWQAAAGAGGAPARPVELQVRMGLNTGLVVVGGIGDRLRMDYTAVGDTTNLAARLQQLAAPGEILISESTERLVRDQVKLEALAPAQVKGKSEAVAAFRLLAAVLRHDLRGGMRDKALTPFVGRQRELAILEALLEQATAGLGQVIGIAGESGSGKSRLLYEFHYRIWDRPVTWWSGRCMSFGSRVPYLPLSHLLRDAWSIADGDDAATVTAKTRRGLQAIDGDPESALPYILDLLGIGGGEALAGLEPQAIHKRTFAHLRQVVLSSCRQQPLVLQIEDLHWSDESSVELIDHLVEGLAGARLILLLSYRSGFQPRWMDRSYATQITMRALSARDSRTVVDAVVRRTQLPEDATRLILDKAEGNPFFLEELTRSITEKGAWETSTVPDTIQGVLMARVDRLPEQHKRLLQTAAILGREFSAAVLERLWDQGDAISKLLQDLIRWEFLYDSPDLDEGVYFFKHALTQEVAYHSLLVSRRQALHAAAGRGIEELYADRLEELYQRLAFHWSAAGEKDKALFYLPRVARRAAAQYAHAEAAQALREALPFAAALELPEAERDRRVLELVLTLAESLLPLALLQETLQLCLEHQPRVERLQDPAMSCRFHFWLAHTYSYLGRQDEAARYAQRALAEAAACGDDSTRGRACYVLSRDGFWSGQFRAGIEYGKQAVALLARGGDLWWQGQAYWVAGFHYYVLGRFGAAAESMERSKAIWEVLGDSRLDPSWSTGYFHASLGDWETGLAECQGGLDRSRDPLNEAVARGFLGYAYLEKGDIARSIQELEESVRQLAQIGMRPLLGWFSAFLADAYLLAGRREEAAERARLGLAINREAGFGYGAGLAQAALGRIAAASGDAAGSRGSFEEALTTFAELEVPLEQGRIHLELARLAGTHGDAAGAALELAAACAVFSRLDAERLRDRAARLAAALGVAVAGPVPRGMAGAEGGEAGTAGSG
ncbi:MAG TPA: adenylate/guanylate cyclase domain-containing protein, partial [Thermoanaerobaculia bacterium]